MSDSSRESRSFEAHGFRFAVASPDRSLIAAVDDLLVDMIPSTADAGIPKHRFEVHPNPVSESGTPSARVTLDGDDLYPTLVEGSIVSHVLLEVNRRAVDACRRAGDLALHAGTVAGASGVIVLPGATHSGKSTVATALAVQGGRLHADEVSRLDPSDLTVARLGKPVALRPASVELLAPRIPRLGRPGGRFETDERFVPPSEIGRTPTGSEQLASVEVSSIVFPRFDPAEPTRLTRISPAATIERLMDATLGGQPDAKRLTRADFRALERLARAVPAHELDYAELPAALAVLAEIAN